MADNDNKENRIYVAVSEDCPEPQWLDMVEPYVSGVLQYLKLSGWELSVFFCLDPFMRDLNNRYRGIDAPTDVLSFEQGGTYCDDDGAQWFAAGDIAISLDTLERNSAEFSVGMDEELKRLLLHGILHLNGYDHSDNSPEQEMLVFQESVLPVFDSVKIIC